MHHSLKLAATVFCVSTICLSTVTGCSSGTPDPGSSPGAAGAGASAAPASLPAQFGDRIKAIGVALDPCTGSFQDATEMQACVDTTTTQQATASALADELEAALAEHNEENGSAHMVVDQLREFSQVDLSSCDASEIAEVGPLCSLSLIAAAVTGDLPATSLSAWENGVDLKEVIGNS